MAKINNISLDSDQSQTILIKANQQRVWSGYDGQAQMEWLADEVPVALVYNGISHVVMMATPDNLEAFALGFSLSEGIVSCPGDIYGIELVSSVAGIEVQIELSSRCFMALKMQRRAMEGRTGCGVCGVEQLSQVLKPVTPLPFTQRFDPGLLDNLLANLRQLQPVGQLTGCTHLAAWINPVGELSGGCEDVGRHVALDKLLGARVMNCWESGVVFISSRASYEMVQKAAMCGVEILLAASAATRLAVDIAERYQLTLAGFCRAGRLTIYTHPERLLFTPAI